MNKGFLSFSLIVLFAASAFAQTDLQRLSETERSFHRALTEHGIKTAFLNVLSADAVIFRPDAVNGREFWLSKDDNSSQTMIRKSTFADIAANGLIGYTTGTWELHTKVKGETEVESGQYATIWSKKPDGRYQMSVDICTTHGKVEASEAIGTKTPKLKRDQNKKGWSVADSSMNYFRLGMGESGLSGAYKTWAAEEIRLLLERTPPITGKKKVVAETKDYISISFPQRIAAIESADMAYLWTPCQFANSDEGREKGNCLNVWKLRNKKWSIVLSVFARIFDETPPVLVTRNP